MAEITDRYKSIAAPSEGLFKDNGSRFIAFAYPIDSADEVKPLVDALKKEYHDARHHCFAYRVGPTGETFRSSDDGEPSGSAGRPILGQIDSAGLSDVLVVVVRYFGGIKLGIPGLIRAYKSSTADALAAATIVEKTARKPFRVEFGYLSMNPVMKVLKDMGLPQEGTSFGESCSLTTRVPLSEVDAFESRMENIEDCKTQII